MNYDLLGVGLVRAGVGGYQAWRVHRERARRARSLDPTLTRQAIWADAWTFLLFYFALGLGMAALLVGLVARPPWGALAG